MEFVRKFSKVFWIPLPKTDEIGYSVDWTPSNVSGGLEGALLWYPNYNSVSGEWEVVSTNVPYDWFVKSVNSGRYEYFLRIDLSNVGGMDLTDKEWVEITVDIQDSEIQPGGPQRIFVLNSSVVPFDANMVEIMGDSLASNNATLKLKHLSIVNPDGDGVVVTGSDNGIMARGGNHDIDAKEIYNLVKTTSQFDGVAFSDIQEMVMAMVNGRFKINEPETGKITFYKRDNTTPLFVVTVTDYERTRD